MSKAVFAAVQVKNWQEKEAKTVDALKEKHGDKPHIPLGTGTLQQSQK